MRKKILCLATISAIFLLVGCWDGIELESRGFAVSIGIDSEPSDKDAFDKDSDKEGSDKEGSDKEGSDKEGSDKEDSDKEDSDKEDSDKESSDKESSNKEDSDKEGSDKESSDKEGSDKEDKSTQNQHDGQKDRFKVSVALPDLGALSQKDDEKAESVKSATGVTVSGAIRNIDKYSDKSIYFGLTRIAVLGSGVLSQEELFRESIDVLERDGEFSRNLILLATDNEASDILETKIPGEPISGLFVSNFYRNKGSDAFMRDLGMIARGLRKDGTAIIPQIKSDKDKKELRITGAAVVRDFALVGWLDEVELRGLMYVKQGMAGERVSVKLEDGYAALRIDSVTSKINFLDDGSCSIDVKVHGVAEEYTIGKKNLSVLATELEQGITETINKEIMAACLKLKTLGVDGLGLGESMRKWHNGMFKRFEELGVNFSELDIRPEIKVIITGTGGSV